MYINKQQYGFVTNFLQEREKSEIYYLESNRYIFKIDKNPKKRDDWENSCFPRPWVCLLWGTKTLISHINSLKSTRWISSNFSLWPKRLFTMSSLQKEEQMKNANNHFYGKWATKYTCIPLNVCS